MRASSGTAATTAAAACSTPRGTRGTRMRRRAPRPARARSAAGGAEGAGDRAARRRAERAWARLDEEPANALFLGVFRDKIAESLGVSGESPALRPGYAGLIQLTLGLNNAPLPAGVRARGAARGAALDTRSATRGILNSLFPPHLPWLFKKIIAEPLPVAAGVMNAVATFLTCAWLMGPLELRINAWGLGWRAATSVRDLDGGEGGGGAAAGAADADADADLGACDAVVVVERCRFLEEAGCYSVCVNSCKLPTQDFFNCDMGVTMVMEPDYETLGCKFKFGKAPPAREEDDPALKCLPACMSGCPKASGAAPDGCSGWKSD